MKRKCRLIFKILRCLCSLHWLEMNCWYLSLLVIARQSMYTACPITRIKLLFFKDFLFSSIQICSRDLELMRISYSTINLVWPTLKHAITLSKRSFWLFGLHTLFHIPQGQCPFAKKKFRSFFPKNLQVKNEKSIENVVTYFFEFIGFMVF